MSELAQLALVFLAGVLLVAVVELLAFLLAS